MSLLGPRVFSQLNARLPLPAACSRVWRKVCSEGQDCGLREKQTESQKSGALVGEKLSSCEESTGCELEA